MNAQEQRIQALQARVDELEGVLREPRDASPELESEDADVEWLSDHFAELSVKYRGRAVAIADHRVVAHGQDLKAAGEGARSAGYPEALLTYFPVDEPRRRA